jgi:hypothetical protein
MPIPSQEIKLDLRIMSRSSQEIRCANKLNLSVLHGCKKIHITQGKRRTRYLNYVLFDACPESEVIRGAVKTDCRHAELQW